jgi:dihydrofolate reductase
LNIVITRQRDYHAEGAKIVSDALAAISAAGPVDEIAVIGGGEIYRAFFPLADRIYLTEVDVDVVGDTHFPSISSGDWQETARESHTAGTNDSAGFTLRTLERLK